MPSLLQTDLFRQLLDARENTDDLFRIVRAGALYDRPIPERHRIVFYIGHLEAFDWNLIARGPLDLPAFNSGLDRLFAFGIDPGEGNLPSDQPHDWPPLKEIQEYKTRVRETLDRYLDRVPDQLLHVALEHRLMHSETLAYMFHNLPYDRKIAPDRKRLFSAPTSAPPAVPAMVRVTGGAVRLGRERDAGFGWDNEFDAHNANVASFSAGRYKVTNREYLRFVESGAPAPHFWRKVDGTWLWRGMFEEFPLPLDWPVYVSQQEAARYAAWAGKRLLTEPEFHMATAGVPDSARDNFDFHYWDPIPVTASRDNARGLSQIVGNGWEWTSTPFAPFPGFKPFPFYPGYSANFFDGEHFVLKGASPRTATCMARTSFRNWFRASYPYVYGTFRLVEN